jgi:group I intron endonuclease
MPLPSPEVRDWAIYKVTSPTGRVYIGVTCNLKKRRQAYSSLDCKSQPVLFSSLKKYGFSNHQFNIVDTFTSSHAFAQGKEMFWIKSFMSNGFKYPEQRGMNRSDGGQGTIGFKMSDEQKQAQSKRISGFKHTDEAKRKIAEAGKGNRYNLGRKQSKETIEKRTKHLFGNKFREGKTTSNLQKKIVSDLFSKSVSQYTLNGDFISEFSSMAIASKETKVSKWSIRECAYGRVTKPRKFIFKLKQLCL